MSNFYKYDIELRSRADLPDAVVGSQGITVNAGHYWMTSNRDHTVSKVTDGLEVLFTFSVLSEATLPLGIAHDSEHLWVVGTDKNSVFKYTEQGAYTGVKFSTSSEVTYPDGICWDGTHIWIVGTGNFNAYQYTHDGVYTGFSFPLQVVAGTVRDITWDGESFWVISSLDNGDGQINRYDENGSYSGDEFASLGNHGIYYYNEQLHVIGSSSSELFIYTVTKAVKTYQETILETEGLLGYYPLYVNEKDLSGVGSDMQNVGVNPLVFSTETLSKDGVGSFETTAYDPLNPEKKEGFLSLEQATGIASIELWIKVNVVTDGYNGLIGYNMAGNTDSNNSRVMLTYDGQFNSLRLRVGDQTVEFDYDLASIATPSHVILQYESDINYTIAYIEGVEVCRILGNGFTPFPDCKVLAGAFTYTSPTTGGVGYYGNSIVSDFALYNRPLTRTEIWQRAKYGTYDGMVLGSDSLLAYYKLDGNATDESGSFDGVASNVTYSQGKFDQSAVFNGDDAWVDTGSPFANSKGGYSFYYKYGDQVDRIISSVSVNPICNGQISVTQLSSTSFIFEVVNSGSNNITVETPDLDDGNFHHFALGYESNGLLTCYVDGVLLGSLSIGLVEGNNTQNLWFMRYPRFDTSYKNGQLEKVEVHNRPLLPYEITARVNGGYAIDPIVNLLLSLSSITWSNRETKAQANPQPIYLTDYGIEAVNAKYVVKNNPFYTDPILDQQGELRKFGYIANTTQISGVPIGNKRVMLFAQDSGMLIDETVSDKAGNYRFESLLMSKKYMVTAQYGNTDELTPPDYQAVSSDWQTPTPYGTKNEDEQ